MTTSDRTFLLAEMTSVEVKAQIAAGRSTIVVPFGAVEQHGPHLPLDTDAVLGDRLGLLVARRLNALCPPAIRIGCSQHHMSFAGTLSFKPETLHLVVHDLVESLATHGFYPASSPYPGRRPLDSSLFGQNLQQERNGSLQLNKVAESIN